MQKAIYRRSAPGFSLLELLTAMALGGLVTAGLIAVFSGVKYSYNHNERVARLQEKGRAALHALADEMRHADFLGHVIDREAIAINDDDNDESNNVFTGCYSWAYNFTENAITGSDTPSSLISNRGLSSCTGAVTSVDGESSMVALKKVASSPTAWGDLSDGALVLRANSSAGTLGKVKKSASSNPGYDDLPAELNTAPAADEADWVYEPKIFFISQSSNCDGTDDGIPTLCVAEGETLPLSEMRPMIEGVETLHVEYGFDIDDDGSPNTYYTTTSPAGVSGEAVTAKIYLLVRDTEADPHYTDTNCYQLGSKKVPDPPACTGACCPFNDHYHRTQFSTTVILYNQRNL